MNDYNSIKKDNNPVEVLSFDQVKAKESLKLSQPKKIAAILLGSLSMTAFGVKAFGATDGLSLSNLVYESTDTTNPDTTIPTDGTTPPDTTNPDTTIPTDGTTPPEDENTNSQDVYGDICGPLGWSSCGEYNIYDSEGNLVNRVIANNDWSSDYIASISGGGADGSAEIIRNIDPR